jgi:hypothetical protein
MEMNEESVRTPGLVCEGLSYTGDCGPLLCNV